MFWSNDWSRNLNFRPFSYEVEQSQGLDGCPWLEVQCESSEFNCPFGDSTRGISVVENFAEREVGDECDVVVLEVMVQLPGGEKNSV